MCEHVFVSDSASSPVATILHADLDAFFASVEQRDDPRLRGQPVIVGGGVVMAASYEARAFGVRGAMGGRQARQLCPHAIVVPPRMSAYTEASKAVFDVFRSTTPLVEGISIDEAFLDVGGLRRVSGPAETIAAQLRRAVLEHVGLRITVGGARTKFLSKVASRVAKPDGLLIVPPAHELEFLHALPVDRPLGRRPCDRRQAPRSGYHHRARGRGPRRGRAGGDARSGRRPPPARARPQPRRRRPVQPGRRRRSMGAQRALGRGRRPASEIAAMLDELLDGVARRLRSARVVGHTVVLRLRFDDFTRITRSSTLASRLPTRSPYDAPCAISWPTPARPSTRVGLTLVGIAVTNLTDADAVQLRLPFDGGAGIAIDHALDAVRDRFGGACRSVVPRCSVEPAGGRCPCFHTGSRAAAPRLAP